MSPSQTKNPTNQTTPNLTTLKKAVSEQVFGPPLSPKEAFSAGIGTEDSKRDKIEAKDQSSFEGPDTSEFSAKILLLGSLVKELSIDSQLKRKDELENALFVLEKEHLNGLASDSSYSDIKTKIISELRKIDLKLAVIRAYSLENSEFKKLISEIEDLVETVVSEAKKSDEDSKVEGVLSDLTRRYFAGEIGEENYYDLKAKLLVKLGPNLKSIAERN